MPDLDLEPPSSRQEEANHSAGSEARFSRARFKQAAIGRREIRLSRIDARSVIPPSEWKVERRQEVPHAASLTMKHSRGDFSCLAASALQGFAEISRDK